MHVFELQLHPEIFLSGRLPALVWLLILLALTFDFLNGLHDAANSVATVVSTRVLRPFTAVVWAAFFNFVAFLVFPTKVAGTIQGDVIDQAIIDNSVIAATLLAACGWNVLTWYLGLPTSSSHALIGGMVGAALAKTGSWSYLKADGLVPILIFIAAAPLIGFVFGVLLMTAVSWLFRWWSPRAVDRVFRRGQLISAALFSLGHGGNDAQKTMGIIFALLLAFSASHPNAPWKDRFVLNPQALHKLEAGSEPVPAKVLDRLTALRGQAYSTRDAFQEALTQVLSAKDVDRYQAAIVKAADNAHVPVEVVLACHLAMGLGTLCGGWRIVKTMGQRIIHLRPVDGFCAETAAAGVLALTTFVKGIPISTTHTITGAIFGVGALRRLTAVRWGVGRRIVYAWFLTIPGAGIMAAVCWWLLQGLGLLTSTLRPG
jgi:PiT family inorganic phosphate transporter